MLRVAILALSAKSYGSDSYFQALLPALARYGEKIECLVLTRDSRYRRLCESNGNVKLRQVELPWLQRGWARIVWEQIVLPRKLMSMGVDVVYTANNVGILMGPVPCVVAIRNMEPLVPAWPSAPASFKLRHKLLRFLTIQSIRQASQVVAVSNFVKDTLLARGVPPEKVTVIYHGIDDLAPADAEAASAVLSGGYVASVSKFIRYANLETLFRAFAKMRGLGYQGQLRLAGGSYDKRYEQQLKTLIRKLEIEPHVRLLGYLTRHEVQALIRGCNVFLFSSTLEACPFTLLEAMRQGAPIVTTTARPMREFCGDAAVYVNPTDYDAFGEVAYRLAVDHEVSQTLRLGAKRRAACFRWEDTVNRLVALWESAKCAS